MTTWLSSSLASCSGSSFSCRSFTQCSSWKEHQGLHLFNKKDCFTVSIRLLRSSMQVHADLYTVDLSLFPLQLFLWWWWCWGAGPWGWEWLSPRSVIRSPLLLLQPLHSHDPSVSCPCSLLRPSAPPSILRALTGLEAHGCWAASVWAQWAPRLGFTDLLRPSTALKGALAHQMPPSPSSLSPELSQIILWNNCHMTSVSHSSFIASANHPEGSWSCSLPPGGPPAQSPLLPSFPFPPPPHRLPLMNLGWSPLTRIQLVFLSMSLISCESDSRSLSFTFSSFTGFLQDPRVCSCVQWQLHLMPRSCLKVQ